MNPSNIVIGLDVGTTKICTVVAELEDDHHFSIIGLGVAPSQGVEKGVVVNIEETAQAIRRSIDEAGRMADFLIDNAFVGIAGSHISSMNSKAIVAVGGEGRDINDEDVQRAIDAAKTFALPPNREIIHVLPRSYAVDEQNGIRDPRGMSGVRLEVDVHIVMGGVTWVQNLLKSATRADLDVENVVLQSIASAAAALTHDERELGVCLVDIGGGTTDIAVFSHGSVMHTAVLPIGGTHITKDIALGLRTPVDRAEELKIREASAVQDLIDPEKTIEVPSPGGDGVRSAAVKDLCDIVEARMEEIFTLIKKEIQKSGTYDLLAAGGVVLTGGTSLMRGARGMAERILGLPVRLGKPLKVKGLAEKVDSPIFATAVGLIHFAQAQQSDALMSRTYHGSSLWELVFGNLRNWLRKLF